MTVDPNSTSVPLKRGSVVKHMPTNLKVVIQQVINPQEVLVRVFDGEKGQLKIVKLDDLGPPADAHARPPKHDVAEIPEDEWTGRVAKRVALVLALREAQRTGGKTVQQVAAEHGVSRITAYRALWTYEIDSAAGFARQRRADLGLYDIDKQTDAIITQVIKRDLFRQKNVEPPPGVPEATFGLPVNQEKPKSKANQRNQAPEKRVTLKNIQQEINRICQAVGAPRPSLSTLRRRIDDLDRMKLLRAREGRKGVQRLEANRGTHEVQRPHDEWQVDHTLMDVIIVHRHTHQPIGRAFATFIVDVRTRVVVGWHVTLEQPSSFSVTLALVRAMLRKDGLRARYSLNEEYPVWGGCILLHADNAKEFRGRTLALFCATHRMDLRWRPVKKPQYGGHIERLIGTFMANLRGLHGATLSNVKQRKDAEYDPEGNALYTFEQLDEIIAGDVETYNNSVHTALNMTPLQKYVKEVFGDDGIGPRDIIQGDDEQQLYIDALPYKELKVQKEGIKWDHVYYRSEILRALVRDGKPYIVRRNPMDISQLYFWHPGHQRHYVIPYRDTRHGVVSVWELRQANKELRDLGKDVGERALFAQIERRRQIEAQALDQHQAARSKRSKVARRNDERLHQADVLNADMRLPKTEPAQSTPAFARMDVTAIQPARRRGRP